MKQFYLSDELIPVPFVPKTPGMELAHHPVQFVLQLKVFTVGKCSKYIEQNLFSNVKWISSGNNRYFKLSQMKIRM